MKRTPMAFDGSGASLRIGCAILSVTVSIACATAPAPASVPGQRPKDSIWVVRPVEGLGLFQDERVESARLLSAWLEKKGYRTADGPTLEALARARQGKNALTDLDCGRPLDAFEATRRWDRAFGLAGLASAYVWCEDEEACELSVSGAGDSASALRFRGSIARSGSRLDAFSEALNALAPAASQAGGLGTGVGGLGRRDGRRSDELEVRLSSADRRLPAKGIQAPALTLAQASTCLGADSDHATILLEVDGAGTATRCESALELDRPPEKASCLCAAVERTGPQPALAGRRWSLSVTVRRADRLTRDGRLVVSAFWNTRIVRVKTDRPFPRSEERVDDRSLEGWSPGPARLAASCFESRTAPGQLSSRWAVWFDARGNATKAEEEPEYAPLDPVTRECVASALMTSQAPCPSRGGLRAMADLHVVLRDPNVKEEGGTGGLGPR